MNAQMSATMTNNLKSGVCFLADSNGVRLPPPSRVEWYDASDESSDDHSTCIKRKVAQLEMNDSYDESDVYEEESDSSDTQDTTCSSSSSSDKKK